MRLTDAKLRRLTSPGKHADGGGLFLHISPTGGRYWRMKYRHSGKEKLLAFGVYPAVSLKEARERRDSAKQSLARGDDPGLLRKTAKIKIAIDAANSFKAVALEWHKANAKRWAAVTAAKTLKHLEADVFPVIGNRPVSAITPPEVLAMLRKIEARGATYTATRLRELCGQIFRFAIATGTATYNPAADLVRAIVAPDVKHRPALTDRRQFGHFLRDLDSYQAADRLTLQATRLALLTFVRSRELRHARWAEIDFEANEWRIPAARMKMGKGLNQAHVVPLSQAATYTGSASNAQRVRLLAALGRYAINTFEAMRYLDVYHCPARVLQTTHDRLIEALLDCEEQRDRALVAFVQCHGLADLLR